jgi:hypothetical protein
VILVAAQGSATDPVSLLLNYGPVGVVALLMAAGFLVPKPTHQSVVKERDDLRVENKALQAARIADQTMFVPRADYQALHDDLARLRSKMEDTIFPGVFRATDTLDKTLQILSRLAERAPV